MHLKLHVTHFTLNTRYENIGPFLSGFADAIMDSNWKLLLESINPDLEIYMGDVIKSFFTPIFNKIPLEEFSDGQSVLEAYPVVSDSKSPMSSSSSSDSSSVRKLSSSAFVWTTLLFALTFQRKSTN